MSERNPLHSVLLKSLLNLEDDKVHFKWKIDPHEFPTGMKRFDGGEKLPKSTIDEGFWKKIYWTTTKQPDLWWKIFTEKPFEERDLSFKKNAHAFEAHIVIIIAALLLVFILLVCGVVCALKYINQNTGTRQAPNRLNVPHPTQNDVISSSGPQTHINTALSSPGNPSNLNIATETPPEYDIVVSSDLIAPYFPEVKPSAPESPPPNYEEIAQKY